MTSRQDIALALNRGLKVRAYVGTDIKSHILTGKEQPHTLCGESIELAQVSLLSLGFNPPCPRCESALQLKTDFFELSPPETP